MGLGKGLLKGGRRDKLDLGVGGAGLWAPRVDGSREEEAGSQTPERKQRTPISSTLSQALWPSPEANLPLSCP